MVKKPQKTSLTSCIRFHEAGHAVVAFELGATIKFVGALGRNERMLLPHQQWSLNLGECGIEFFGDYTRMVYPVTDLAEEVAIIKDAAILFGGIMAHMEHAGISFERAAEMGGSADLAMIDYAMSLLPEEKRQGAINVAKSVCMGKIQSEKGHLMANKLAEDLKSHGVIDGFNAQISLLLSYWHREDLL